LTSNLRTSLPGSRPEDIFRPMRSVLADETHQDSEADTRIIGTETPSEPTCERPSVENRPDRPHISSDTKFSKSSGTQSRALPTCLRLGLLCNAAGGSRWSVAAPSVKRCLRMAGGSRKWFLTSA
jgi:hypothetical protein